MSLPRRREGLLDADVQLAASVEQEPGAAAQAQPLRLLDLVQAEELAEEAAGLRFAAGWSRELDVV
jgi:hypothetical protein